MRLVGGTGSSEEPRLPPGYVLDRSDPEVLVLRCSHGEAVARFSAQGATAEAIERETGKHYRERNRTAWDAPGVIPTHAAPRMRMSSASTYVTNSSKSRRTFSR